MLIQVQVNSCLDEIVPLAVANCICGFFGVFFSRLQD